MKNIEKINNFSLSIQPQRIKYPEIFQCRLNLLLTYTHKELCTIKFLINFQFLGGLSLHLNHLIASRMGICYWQFGTLPIGIFLSNLASRQLDTSLMTSYGHICHMSFFGDSRAIWVLLPKYRAFRKSKFSRWRSDEWSMRLGGFRWADD